MILKKTPLHAQHIALHGRMTDFCGWDMPLKYASELHEHNCVREDAGMFDVSHMTIMDIKGKGATSFLRYLLAHDVAANKTIGTAFYTCMLNDQGGVVDDLIVYRVNAEDYCMVTNASTHDKDVAWVKEKAKPFDVEVKERHEAMIAIQGPRAIEKTQKVFNEQQKNATLGLERMHGVASSGWWIARTGYTGEEGYEIILPPEEAEAFWLMLLKNGISPCGLIARDSLRLEAALSLYGAEVSDTITPLEANLEWTITWLPEDRDFIGRKALEELKKIGVKRVLLGLILEDRGILRSHQKVIVDNLGEGEITSGGYSPFLERSIALARVPKATTIGSLCKVLVRDKLLSARVIKPPFVRNGKKVYQEK